MKKLLASSSLFLVLLISCKDNSTKAVTANATDTTQVAVKEDNTKTSDPKPMMDSATMMQNWSAYMTPGDMQKMLAGWDGNWKVDVKMWETETSAPETSVMKAVNQMILGGRYQKSTISGKMMGQPFEGQSVTGYDNAKKVFRSTWIDNMGTGITMLEGPYDAMSKSISLAGPMVDPTSAEGKELGIRELYKVIDDKTYILEMYCPGTDGKEYKNMEMTFVKM